MFAFDQPVVPFPRLFGLGPLHDGLWSRPRSDSFDPAGYRKVAKDGRGVGNGNELSKPATLRDAATAIVRSIVGTGVLFLPHGVASAGLCGALAMYAVTFTLVVVGSERLITSWQWFVETEGRQISYPDLAALLLGSYARACIQWSIVFLQLGCCVCYYIFVSENLHQVIKDVNGARVSSNLLMAAMMMFEIPMCLLRDLKVFTPFNSIANGLVAGSLLVIIWCSFARIGTKGVHEGVVPVVPETALMFLGTCIFTFEGAAVAIPIGNSLAPSDRVHYLGIYVKVVLGIAILYAFYSLLAYLAYGPDVEVIVTLSLGDSLFPASTIQFIYCIAVLFTFPLQLFPASLELDALLNSDAGSIDTRNSDAKGMIASENSKAASYCSLSGDAMRVILVTLTCAMAIFGRSSLDRIVALLGSLCCAPLAFAVPALMHSSMLRLKAKAVYESAIKTDLEAKPPSLLYISAADALILVLGLVFTILSTANVFATR